MTPMRMSSCSTSLVIRETQTETTERHHLAPVRVAVVTGTGEDGLGGPGRGPHTQREHQLAQPPWKTVRRALKH